MKIEQKTFDDYWTEVGRYIGIDDKVTVESGSDWAEVMPNWDNIDSVVVFRNSINQTLSVFNIDKEEVIYF